MPHFYRLATAIQASVVAVLAVVAFAPNVTAADLGGNCCADLEDRIAELEATTARKGNRKVSLTISGHVAEELSWWDDGVEQNAYLHGLGPTQASHFKFTGQAKIGPGLKAGYTLRIQNLDGNAFGRDAATGSAIDQNSPRFNQGLNTQMSYWFLESETFGKVSVGKLAHAAKSAAMLTDQSGTQLFDNYTFLDGFPQFVIRGSAAPLRWSQLAFCYTQNLALGGDCNGLVMNGVRYDSPAVAGFTVSASWGEDDFWEVAARYAGQIGDFKVAVGTGYSKFTDEGLTGPAVSKSKNSEFLQAGGYVQHLPTGLFIHAAVGYENNNDTVLLNGHIAPDSHHWYTKGGIRQNWTGLGATVIYGDYADYVDQMGPALLNTGASASRLQRYGGGIAQEIDSAAMTLYLKFQRSQGDVTGAAGEQNLENLDVVSAGSIISF